LTISSDIFKEWRAADQAARAAEQAMFAEAMLALDGLCHPPSPIHAQQVKTLRQSANELFELAMAQMGEFAGKSSSNAPATPAPSPAP
jgi:hypothetical protein